MGFTRWLRANADGVVALLSATTVGVLAALEVLGGDQVDAAILLVLASLAVTLLKGRQSAAKVMGDALAVHQLNAVELGQEHVETHRHTEQWIFKGDTGTYLRAVTLKECVEHARREQCPLRMQVEILDPTDDVLCTELPRSFTESDLSDVIAKALRAKKPYR